MRKKQGHEEELLLLMRKNVLEMKLQYCIISHTADEDEPIDGNEDIHQTEQLQG